MTAITLRWLAALPILLVTAFACADTSRTVLSEEAVELLSAEPFPERALDPQGRYLMLVHKRGLQPLRALAEPMVSIGDLRINPRTNGRHAALPYYGLTLVDLWTGLERSVPVPPSHAIGYPQWSPDGSRFVFTVTVDDGIELWGATRDDPWHVRRLIGPVLNAARATPCTWMPGSRELLCQVVARKYERRDAEASAYRLLTQTVATPQPAAADERLAEYFLRSQLLLVDPAEGRVQPLGRAAVIESVEPAPGGSYFLVVKRLPPYDTAGDEAPRRVAEVWDRAGAVVHTVADADGAPPRALQWQASAPATLAWVERRGANEHLFLHPAPFNAPAQILFSTPQRYAGVQWLADTQGALFSEYDPLDRVTRVWLVDVDDVTEPPRLIGSRSVDGAIAGLGWPLTTTNAAGKAVVRAGDGYLYFKGQAQEGRAGRAYLDRVRLDTLARERVWESAGEGREDVVAVLDASGASLLTRRENAVEPPNYWVRNLRAGTARQVTHYRHPVPRLAQTRRVPLRYRRADGLEMASILYLPPDAEPGQPLPLILWAYPREYPEGARLPVPATDEFMDVERSLQLFALLEGYAVMTDVAMPIIGTGRDANDTFVQQVVANAKAAIDAAAATGMVDPNRVAVAGHSYGAFMVANLLAHSDLFKAGVALSGAYNRTLTPFGFQTERRTLWEATDTYLAISPFFYSDRIDAPLLLVHGSLDDNAGTLPIQSQYLYEAIRRNGGEAELLLLPLEGHTYRGRESVLATANAMLKLFDAELRGEQAPLPMDERTLQLNVASRAPSGASAASP
ncbi:MAG TPA: prolyl oligopeptidase family serine peptidase [Gammaproteobacteria bacterium]